MRWNQDYLKYITILKGIIKKKMIIFNKSYKEYQEDIVKEYKKYTIIQIIYKNKNLTKRINMYFIMLFLKYKNI